MANLKFIKSREARIGIAIVLAIVVFVLGFNFIKSNSFGNRDNNALSAQKESNKPGTVESIEYNSRDNNYKVVIVFHEGLSDNVLTGKQHPDTVTITVKEHLLGSILKNYEVPESNFGLHTNTEDKTENSVNNASKPKQQTTIKTPASSSASIKPKTSAATENSIVFKVQFMMSKSFIDLGDESFALLSDVSFYVEDDHYKYTAGEAVTFNDAKNLYDSIAITYPEAFIVAFNNNTRIPVIEAKQILRNSRK
jgi:hypothetical protein